MSVETGDYLAMLRRMLRAAARRVGQADEPELAALVSLRADLDQVIAEAVAGQREAGRSWADIGRALGITRQTAHERFGRIS